ncbi:MAG: phosphoribosylformylglycinamidine cyclo-ligase, partial [Bacteroidetes bacterium]
YKVFNMGHRMELYVAPEVAEELIAISRSFHIDARIVGHVVPSQGKRLTLTGEQGTFEYDR